METTTSSRFLLFTEAAGQGARGCAWRFVLEDLASGRTLSAADLEADGYRERSELLAVVRGLEAIDQPARVTLVTKSRYVSRGLKLGLAEWRASDWQWERFGRIVPVRDHDLWRRVDRALRFHEIECRLWRFEEVHVEAGGAPERSPLTARRGLTATARNRLRWVSRAAASWGDALRPVGFAAG